MFTLLVNPKIKRTLLNYLIIGLSLVLFDLIYEQFSHGIHSNFMRYSFLVLWIGAFIIYSLFYFFKTFNQHVLSIWHMGLTSLILGFTLRGIFDIYGSSEPLNIVFYLIGITLCIISLSIYFLSIIKKNSDKTHPEEKL